MDDDTLDRLLGRLRGKKHDISRLENGFERRVMARIRERRDNAVPFFFSAWRFAPAFLALVIGVGIWWYAAIASQNIDHFASLGPMDEGVQLVAFMTGD